MTDKVFYDYLHCFRGISILLIVGAHCWSMPIFMLSEDNQLPEHLRSLFSAVETLFHGSTIYFAMISGLLYSLVLSDKTYKQFMKTKWNNVFTPYLVVSLLYVGLYGLLGMINLPEDITPIQFVIGFSFAMLFGMMSGHLWYIPVIMILFALTPLLVRIVNSKQRVWFILFLLLPLVISRVWPMFSPATVIYFIAPYMVGIYIGQNLEQVHRWITERQVLLFSIFILFSITYFFMMMNDIKEVQWGFLTINSQETVTYILRMCAALLMLELFRQYVSKVPTWLDYLAKYAFAIYFIHVMFIMLLIKLLEVIDYKPVSAGETFTLGLVTYVVSILGSVLVSMLIKRLTGRYSRQLIGA